MILGIDIGVTGCLVILDESEGFKYIDHLHMPITTLHTKKRVNGAEISRWIDPYYENIKGAFVELVNGMPSQKDGVKMGAGSAFSFGHSAGVIEGLLQGALLPYYTVTPSVWKRNAGLIGKQKDASRSLAIRLYPEIADLSLKAKGQALADAIFIARCAIKPLDLV